jgi:uncharacterized protein YciI
MKQLSVILLLSVFAFGCNKQVNENETTQSESLRFSGGESVYDSILAKKLGADEIGMKKYVIAFLKKGPKRDQDSATAAEIQKGHMANINRMAEEGKLILAGPFFDDFDIRGIYIFNVETIEEAEALTKTDPAIKSGRLSMELHPWYGSAALMEVNAIHNRVAKKGF